jgi:hypothetical protein
MSETVEQKFAYAVTFGYAYEPSSIMGVFGSYEKAEEFCKAYVASSLRPGGSAVGTDWEEVELEDGDTCWAADNGHTELKIISTDWEPKFQ